jgi:hypothetical protein
MIIIVIVISVIIVSLIALERAAKAALAVRAGKAAQAAKAAKAAYEEAEAAEDEALAERRECLWDGEALARVHASELARQKAFWEWKRAEARFTRIAAREAEVHARERAAKLR